MAGEAGGVEALTGGEVVVHGGSCGDVLRVKIRVSRLPPAQLSLEREKKRWKTYERPAVRVKGLARDGKVLNLARAGGLLARAPGRGGQGGEVAAGRPGALLGGLLRWRRLGLTLVLSPVESVEGAGWCGPGGIRRCRSRLSNISDVSQLL